MASTFSNLKFELIGTGDQAGDWGNTTNSNFGTAVEQAITGMSNPVFTSDDDLTITLTNTTALQVARALVLDVTSAVSLTATRSLIVPTIQKQYIVENNTSGGRSILVQTVAGSGILVPNGRKAHLYVDGADVVDAVSYFSSLALGSALPVTSGGTGTTTPSLVGGLGIGVSGAFPNQTISSFVNYQQNIQSGNYTLVLADAGKQIFHPASSPFQRDFTIPANSVVPFPIGTQVLFTVENGGRTVRVACDDTLVFGSGITGTIPVLPNNTLACIKVTATKWMANYLYQTGTPPTSFESIAIGSSSAIAYPVSATGFGTRYTDPTVGWPGSVLGVTFSPSGRDIALAHGGSPHLTVYPFTGQPQQPYGTKYADPASLPAIQGNSVAFTHSGDAIAVVTNGTPFIAAYPWSSAGFGARYANPGTLPTGAGNGVAFSPADDYIAVAHSTTPFMSVYAWSFAGGFGTRSTNPATLPASTGRGITFSPAGTAIAVAHNNTPFISVYPFSVGIFGTRFANPATLPTGNANSVAFNPAGNAIAVAHDTTPWMSVYNWSGAGFGSRFSNPGVTPTGVGNGIDFNPSGTLIAIAHAVTPFVSMYPWSGSGFGTKFANPNPLPSSTGNAVAFTINP